MNEKEKPIDWGFRVMHNLLSEYVIPGKDLFEGIEDALKTLQAERDALQQRVAELEAQAADEARITLEMEQELNDRITELEAENQKLQDAKLLRINELTSALRGRDTIIDELRSKLADMDEKGNGLYFELICRQVLLNETQELVAALKAKAAQLAAAPGAARWEVEWTVYDNAFQATQAQKRIREMESGWQVGGWQIRDDNTVTVMWQRMARQEEAE